MREAERREQAALDYARGVEEKRKALEKRFEKTTKITSKTAPGPLRNRCPKYAVFQHRFFRVSASILEGLGPVSYTHLTLPTICSV